MCEHTKCENIDENDGLTYDCEKLYDCCDCGVGRSDNGFECCPYCWSCNACDYCKSKREED